MSYLQSFSFGFVWRVLALFASFGAAAWLYNHKDGKDWGWTAIAVAVFWAFNLFRYVNDTNRRLTRFFESVRYSDFAIRFSSAKEKGDSFEAVNRQFNEVMEAFRQTRAEKEANLLFMNAMVQHLTTGVLAFDTQQNLLLSNNAALQLLGIYRIQRLADLPQQHQALTSFVTDLNARGKLLYQPDAHRQLAVQGVNLNLQGRNVRLLTLQNIQPELQGKEIDAWRDLTRVLRHEIMNSVTPIVSLVETMQDIVKYDLNPQEPCADDLKEALEVVGTRSRGLMNFVEAYRTFTALPQPHLEDIGVKKFLERVVHLATADAKNPGPTVTIETEPETLQVRADVSQIEMVLLNLVKNAKEALESQPATLNRAYFRVQLRAFENEKHRVIIEVEDNGPGIPEELLEEIFIPFFTTKSTGTGVGLSISRQIMQAHEGEIRVRSTPGQGTVFTLIF
jgi:two-component system, NtrC family, nitrogen regulation sensor histidine kinase NtrY